MGAGHDLNLLDEIIKRAIALAGNARRAAKHVPEGTSPEEAAALIAHRLNDDDICKKTRIWRYVATNPMRTIEEALVEITLNSDDDKRYKNSVARKNYIRSERSNCLRALKITSLLGTTQQDGNSKYTDLFDPNDIIDTRESRIASIKLRHGQPKFRSELLAAYCSKCAISGSPTVEVLDAAHIHPHLGERSNRVNNGLLLRTDLHTLFDLYLISISSNTRKVAVAPSLMDTNYRKYHGTPLAKTQHSWQEPSEMALRWHREQCEW